MKSSLYAKTLGSIIQMIVKPPEGLYELVADFNRWKDLLDATIGINLESVLSAENSNNSEIRRKLEMIKIVNESVKDLLSSLESYQDIRRLIINELDVNKESNIILYSTLIDENKWGNAALQFLDKEDIDKSDISRDVKALQSIMKHISSLLSNKIDNCASLDSILESLNCALTKMGIANIIDNFDIDYESVRLFLKNALDFLIVEEASLEDEESEFRDSDSIILNTIGINLLQFIKMIIDQLHSNDSNSTHSIIDSVFEYSKFKAEAFNFKMNILKENLRDSQQIKGRNMKPKHLVEEMKINDKLSDHSKIIQEHEYEVIECIAEVINNIIPYVHPLIDEDVLYTLIGTHIESIQKAAYLTLKFFYENFIPPLKYKYEEEIELNEEEFKEQIEKELKENEETKEETIEEAKDDHDKVNNYFKIPKYFRLKF